MGWIELFKEFKLSKLKLNQGGKKSKKHFTAHSLNKERDVGRLSWIQSPICITGCYVMVSKDRQPYTVAGSTKQSGYFLFYPPPPCLETFRRHYTRLCLEESLTHVIKSWTEQNSGSSCKSRIALDKFLWKMIEKYMAVA